MTGGHLRWRFIPGQPSGPAAGSATRTRSAVAVAVPALPRRGERNRGRGDAGALCAADTTHSQAWPADESSLCAKGHDRATRMPDCQQSTRTAGGSIIGQATAGYRPGERAPEPPLMDVRQLDQYQADAHAGRRLHTRLVAAQRPPSVASCDRCLGRRPPFVPPISTAAGQHGRGGAVVTGGHKRVEAARLGWFHVHAQVGLAELVTPVMLEVLATPGLLDFNQVLSGLVGLV